MISQLAAINLARKTKKVLGLLCLLQVFMLSSPRAQATGLSAVQPKVDSPDVAEIYIDQMPEFAGELNEWLGANLIYPKKAIEAEWEEKVLVKFVVAKNGTIKKARIEKSSNHKLLDDEALRVVKAMPRWKPGRLKGKAKAVYFTMPVTFQLE